jgi:hypothetical protein
MENSPFLLFRPPDGYLRGSAAAGTAIALMVPERWMGERVRGDTGLVTRD